MLSAPTVRNLKLVIAYTGENFSGWQSQPDANAVQDHLEAALLKIVGSRVVVHGAGRTDAGVHALAQCANIQVPEGMRMAPLQWQAALNGNLPREIRIMRCVWAHRDFHARFSANGKQYRYTVVDGLVLPPRYLGTAWHVPVRLDVASMRDFLTGLVGDHDFRAFAANRGVPVEDTRRTISHAALRQQGRVLEIDFVGNGFLYKMVRLLTGTAVRCGRGKLPVADALAMLRNPQAKAIHMAPAEGLTLVRVLY